MKYSYILLDADNTLFDFDACEKQAFYRAMTKLGILPTDALYSRYSAINDACWKALERGELTREALQATRYRRLAEEFSLSIDPDLANDTYLSCLAQTDVLYPGAVEFVKALAKTAKLYIVTNGLARVQTGRLERSPIFPYIEKVFISEMVGAAKPDSAFFEAVAKGIDGFDPTRAIVIGDSLTSDIKGANNASLACIWYNPNRKSKGNEAIDHIVSNYNEILRILL